MVIIEAMAVKKPGPRRELPDLEETTDQLDRRQIVDDEPLEDAFVYSGDFSGLTLSKLVVRRSVVESVSFAQTQIRSLRLKDVRFVRCDFSNAVLRGFEANRVEFIDCRLLGLKALECRMEDVLFERCDGRYAQFQDGSAVRCDFLECLLQEADFRAANLSHTRWAKSNLQRADLLGARLLGADLRGADTEGMQVAAPDLHGAVVSPSQAMDFAKLLGLIIR